MKVATAIEHISATNEETQKLIFNFSVKKGIITLIDNS
jgi:hypothetical protein